jgi:hypothetical protein
MKNLAIIDPTERSNGLLQNGERRVKGLYLDPFFPLSWVWIDICDRNIGLKIYWKTDVAMSYLIVNFSYQFFAQTSDTGPQFTACCVKVRMQLYLNPNRVPLPQA